jgi:hypothetical protein
MYNTVVWTSHLLRGCSYFCFLILWHGESGENRVLLSISCSWQCDYSWHMLQLQVAFVPWHRQGAEHMLSRTVEEPLSQKCHFRSNDALHGHCTDRMFHEADGFRTKSELSRSWLGSLMTIQIYDHSWQMLHSYSMSAHMVGAAAWLVERPSQPFRNLAPQTLPTSRRCCMWPIARVHAYLANHIIARAIGSTSSAEST